MKKAIDQTKITQIFYLITIVAFVFIYLWWLRLTPFIFEHILYLVFLSAYIFLTIIFWFSKKGNVWRPLLFISTIVFFCLNSLIIGIYLPSLDNAAKCQGATYYISDFSPFSDERWTYYQLTKWDNIFKYKTSVFPASGGGQFEIICDDKMKEVNFVKVFPFSKMLIYTDGEHPRNYEMGTEIENYIFYPSPKCNRYKNEFNCDSYTYKIYKCELNNTLCIQLPLQYTGEYAYNIDMVFDAATKEINVYFDFEDNSNTKTLIFTYGEHPRCYVEGCEILEESK